MARTLEYTRPTRAPESETVIGLIAFLLAAANPILMVIFFSMPWLNEQLRKLSPSMEFAAVLCLPVIAFLLGMLAIFFTYTQVRGKRSAAHFLVDILLLRRERLGCAAAGGSFLVILFYTYIHLLPFR